MKRKLLSTISLLCLLVWSPETTAYAQNGNAAGCYQYTVKIICGRGDGRIMALGTYYTAVNILNAGDSTVTFTKKFVSAPEGRPGLASDPVSVTLKECQAIEVDCPEIMQYLRYPPGVYTSIRKGFLVIRSNRPLDIVAVYTAAGGRRRVESIHTERVPANTESGCADLIVERIDRPEWDHANGRSIITVTIKNIGCSRAAANYARLVDPSTKQPSGAPFNDVVLTPALNPGESATLTFYLPYWVYNPDAELEATADYKNVIQECNEKNNTKKFFELG